MDSSESTRLVPAPVGFQQQARNGQPRSLSIEDPLEISSSGENDRQVSTCSCSNGPGKCIVFGGYDGALASLIIISACIGGGLSNQTIFTVSIANLVATALSIGISEYRSSKAHQAFLQAEKCRELWDFRRNKDREVNEMINRYKARGMTRADATTMVSTLAQYESIFVNLMVVEELGLQISDDDESMFLMDAFMMLCSFAVAGTLPVLVFSLENVLRADAFNEEDLCFLALACSFILLTVLGIIKSSFSSASPYVSAVEAVVVGAACSGAAFLVGAVLRSSMRN